MRLTGWTLRSDACVACSKRCIRATGLNSCAMTVVLACVKDLVQPQAPTGQKRGEHGLVVTNLSEVCFKGRTTSFESDGSSMHTILVPL